MNLHVYHYTGNNPVKYVDPDGEWLTNNTNRALVVRDEDGNYELLEAGGTFFGKVDGAIMQDGTIIKITDADFSIHIPATNVVIKTNAVNVIINQDENGEYSFDLPDLHSNTINYGGDIIKNYTGDVKSGVYKATERPGPLQSWWNGATSDSDDGKGDPSTWDGKAFQEKVKSLIRNLDE